MTQRKTGKVQALPELRASLTKKHPDPENMHSSEKDGGKVFQGGRSDCENAQLRDHSKSYK